MSAVPDYSLFPNKEEWGTGDEAMDNKLSLALKNTKADLTLASIKEFFLYGLSLKPRAYNPAFHTTIELVTKAFLFCFDPDAYNDQLILKMKGDYESKKRVPFQLVDAAVILSELKSKKVYRYKGQVDFYLNRIEIAERNPFIRLPLKRSSIDLHTKIIMKDFKAWMSGEKESSAYSDDFFNALKDDSQILLIDNFGEFWYHQGQIFSIPTFDI